MRILVTGVDGQIGGELMDLGIEGCELVPADRGCLDLSNQRSIEGAYSRIAPDLVVNCAAYTAVDKAEDEPDLAFSVNAEGVRHLARLCGQTGIPLIQVSTDYVFDGTKTEPYLPSDPVRPLGVYGASKEAGERAVRELCPSHVILRTSWVFSARGNNFVKTMLRIGEKTDTLKVVADQLGNPTSARDVARAIAAVVKKDQSGEASWGTYHFCNRGTTTWHGFAQAIFEIAKRKRRHLPSVEAISTSDYPSAAARPANSVLNTNTFSRTFHYEPRSWHEALGEVMDELLKVGGGVQ